MLVAHAIAIASARGRGQDRARVVISGGTMIVVVADGAGGTSNGAVAAQAIVDAVVADAPAPDACLVLSELDRQQHGQSTAVILSICDGAIGGASVGDSGAWLVREHDVTDLTEHQDRKPLVGAGCRPVPLSPARLAGHTLLIATDGLLRYALPTHIARVARGADLGAAANALIELVRLPGGQLQDDVAVVLCRANELPISHSR